MKIHASILTLGVFQALSWGANAFIFQAPKTAPAVVLKSSFNADDIPIVPEEVKDEAPPAPEEEFAMYPIRPTYETIQGGGTVRTYQMPDWATRAQMALKTNGRPLRATAQLWIGPIRTTHTMKINSMDGTESPYMSTLTFKKLAPAIRLITSDSFELPIEASVWVPPPDRSEAIGKNIEKLWNEATRGDQKKLIQGADVEGGDGAVRTWEIPANVKSVQLVAWSKDTSKFSFKCKLEVLQGPNNKKQDIFLQCGGSTQPFHSVLQTPGAGWIIRVFNKKFVEDGRFELAVMPHEMEGDAPKFASTVVEPIKEKKEWWQ